MINSDYIKNLTDNLLRESELFVLQVLAKPGNKIIVTIDGDRYVTIGDCANVSRLIESALDREAEDFELQVTSAGADHWFSQPRQFPKHIGKKVEVVLRNHETHTGRLIEASPINIVLAAEPKKGKKAIAPENMVLPFENIAKARCIISIK